MGLRGSDDPLDIQVRCPIGHAIKPLSDVVNSSKAPWGPLLFYHGTPFLTAVNGFSLGRRPAEKLGI